MFRLSPQTPALRGWLHKRRVTGLLSHARTPRNGLLPVNQACSPAPMTARPGRPLAGRVRVPGDKSISHRALILGALAVGRTRMSGLLEGEDVLNTAKAMLALGARGERIGDGAWQVDGVGVAGLSAPARPPRFCKSVTGCRPAPGGLR